MEAKLKLVISGGQAVDIVLSGSDRAIEELVERLRAMGGALDVTGGSCCWSMTSRDSSTVHVVVDSEKAAS